MADTRKEKIALVLQGGGALGSYQAGAYDALQRADFKIDWVAGISIGAINGAIICGNPPSLRAERLERLSEHLHNCKDLKAIYVSRDVEEISHPLITKLESIIGPTNSWSSLPDRELPDVAVFGQKDFQPAAAPGRSRPAQPPGGEALTGRARWTGQ